MHFRLLYVFSLILAMSSSRTVKQPNIIVVLTDDQDLVLGGLKPMAKTRQLIGNSGVTFSNAFVTTPICCPSRSSLLTGKYLHNHGTVNNTVAGGCNSAYWQANQEPRAFVTHFKQAGYTTFYAGKYLNQYGNPSVGGYAHTPPGWDWWLGLGSSSLYYNYTMSINGTAKHFKDQYLTDVIKEYGLDFLQQKHVLDQRFLMVLATPAPHAPSIPAPKYRDYFKNLTVFRPPNFNIPIGKDKHWLLRMQPNPLPEDFMPRLDEVYRHRWESLLSVDDLVEAIVKQLDSSGLIQNTFIIYTSDNGYHVGEFSLPWDKRQPYEFDLRVPLLIRGPGIKKKRLVDRPVLNIDLAPTILDIAGLPIPKEMDGVSYRPMLLQNDIEEKQRTFLVEYHGEGDHSSPDCPFAQDHTLSECVPDNLCRCQDARNNTYSCIRHMSAAENVLYCKFEDAENFVEMYDMNKDPYQLYNIAKSDVQSSTKYSCALARIKMCQGATCSISL